jgi:hypothetical protein
MGSDGLRRLVGLGALALALALVSPIVRAAAPGIDEEIAILKARPTGMEEAEWKKRRREAAAKIGDVRSQESVDALLEVVETERYDAVLSIAIEGLGKQGDPRAIPALQAIYGDRSLDTFVREDAGTAITALGGTPKDDARLTGEAETKSGTGDDALLGGPQLGTMGEASVAGVGEGESDPTATDKPLPANVRARGREFSFVVGTLDLNVNTRSSEQPVLADGGLGALARYVDERHRWGWTVRGDLGARIVNGDLTNTPDMAEGDDDTGDALMVSQSLSGVGEIHVYFGKTDVHAFAELGLSERLTHVNIEDYGGGNQSELTDTRFAFDVVPAGGLGWGRYLDGGSDLMVDAIVDALRKENILARELDVEARRALRDAVYRRSNSFSAWPRLSAVLGVLTARGYLARRPGPRLVHRLRSIVEDPSYLDRPKGIRVRGGFLYDAPIAQKDYQRRGSDGVGAPFVQFDAGFQVGLERQVLVDTRFWYDVIGARGFTTDTGVTYTRFLHTKFHDYAGNWFAGVRGGVSHREFADLADGEEQPRVGYRATAKAGYAYGFRRGSEVGIVGEAGVDSGAFVVGLGLGLRVGIVRGSVMNPGAGTTAAPARVAPGSTGTTTSPTTRPR